MSTQISILGSMVSVNESGLISLTDIHKASGAPVGKRPSYFFRDSSYGKSIREEPGIYVEIQAGRGGGSWASIEVAVAYMEYVYGIKAKLAIIRSVSDHHKLMSALSSFEVPDDLPDMYVYAIREKESGNIKLGISRDPQKRMKQLQIGNSQELELVALRKADNRFKDERKLHLENNDSHIHGEWFSPEAVNAIS